MRWLAAPLLALSAGCIFPDAVTRFSLTVKVQTQELDRPVEGAHVEVRWLNQHGEARTGADGLARVDLRHARGFQAAGFGVAPAFPDYPGIALTVLADGCVPHVVALPDAGFLIHDDRWTGMQTVRLKALPLDTDPEGLAVAALKAVVARERRFQLTSHGRSRTGSAYARWYWAGPVDGLLADDPVPFHRRIAGAAAEGRTPASLAGYRIHGMRRTRDGRPYDPAEDDHRPANAHPSEYAYFAWGPRTDWIFAVNERERIWRKRREDAAPDRLPENPASEGWEPVP